VNHLTTFSAAGLLAGLIAAPAFAVSIEVPLTNALGNESGHLRLGQAAMSKNPA